MRKHYAELGSVLPKLELVVTELVTNALVHGTGRIELRLRKQDDGVRGEVTDQGGGFEPVLIGMPDLTTADGRRTGGLGLPLVASLCDHWGVYDGSSHVWFEMRPEPDFGEATSPERSG